MSFPSTRESAHEHEVGIGDGRRGWGEASPEGFYIGFEARDRGVWGAGGDGVGRGQRVYLVDRS